MGKGRRHREALINYRGVYLSLTVFGSQFTAVCLQSLLMARIGSIRVSITLIHDPALTGFGNSFSLSYRE